MVHRRKGVPPKKIAFERMRILFEQARLKKDTDPELATRYMRLVERIGKRMDLSVPKEIKRFYCKGCGIPYGGNARIRIKKGLCFVTCGQCGEIRRIPYRN